MTRARRIAALACGIFLALVGNAASATYPAGFEERTVASGLTQTIAMDWAPDGRMFVAEKHGRLKVVAPGASTAGLVLDISDHVNSAGDRGLEGIAVDSDFANNGYIYLAYVYELNPLVQDSDSAMVSRLTRIKVNPDSTVANPGSPETILLGTDTGGACPAPSNTTDCMPSDSVSHMIGTVRSAPDGTLWVGHGDGAGFAAVEPTALRALDERSLAGKILHIDRNGRGLPGHHFCPAVSDLTQNCTKVHAKGFRNPYRFHVLPNGKLSVGEVGWNTTEEVNLIPEAGKSYGWPCYEGPVRTPGYADLSQCSEFYSREGTFEAETPPSYSYGRDQGSAVIGGPTYSGNEYPPGYRDSIFFGDFTSYTMRRLELDAQGGVTGALPFATGFVATEIENGPDGNLWYTAFGTGAPGDGEVRRIVYSPGNGSPHAAAQADRTSGNAPLTVAFTGSASTDPDHDNLNYDWNFGDGSEHSTQANPTHTYTSTGTFTARLTVDDGRGLTSTATVTIASGGSGPVAQIDAPSDLSHYRDGDTVQLRGTATDAQDGTLTGASLHWRVALRHIDHFHPVTEQNGTAASFAARRDHDADSSYEITLTATDSDGLTASRTITIQPEKVNLRIDSTPDGAPVSYGGRSARAPYTTQTAIGYDTTVTATDRQTIDGRPFWFTGWSDGGARVHDIRVPDTDFMLRALYEEDKASGRPATASSTYAAGFEAGMALDGKPDTRWSSNFAENQYWQVDFGRVRAVDRVYLDWEGAYARRYRVLTSTDGQNFTEAATETISAPGAKTTTFATRNARYVRVQGIERATPYGISFWEARVLGPSDSTDGQPPETAIDSGPPATSSSSTASFTFSSEPGATFECRLDTGEWEACTSPKAYSNLASDAHTFQVRASDTSGATDPSPAEHRFTVDYGENKGLRGAATASSSFGAEFVPAFGNDGDTRTRWSSNFTDGQWWQVDLGRARQVDKVEINWQAAYASSYRLLTSTDGQNFTEAAADAITAAGPHTTAFAARSARYVRIEGIQRSGPFGISIWEARVFGPSDTAPDTTPPETAIDSGPSGTVQSTSATFNFSSEAGATFECSLDTATFTPCSNPRAYTGLSTGPHTFRVRATDQAGNTDASPASSTWTISPPDTTPPQTTIDSGAPATDSPTASFAFSSEAGATFECNMDSAGWGACTPPRQYQGLASGAHTFQVRATDAAGNVDATPAQQAFTLNFGENKGLNGPATASSTYSSAFTPAMGNDGSNATRWSSIFADAQYWQVDLGRSRLVDKVEINWEAAYASSYRIMTSTDGVNFIQAATEAITRPGATTTPFAARSARYVRIDAIQRATVFGVSFWEARVHGPTDADTTPPDTAIDSGPSGTVTSTSASFAFSSEANATFECSLDTAGYTPCTSPRALTGLSAGPHTFRVRAIDQAGNTDASPATRTWTVQPPDTTPPDTTINTGPTGTVEPTSATLTFSSEAGATFQCKLDTGAFAPCTSPQTLTGLSRAQHTFQVRATDAAGNVDATPATRTWTVQTYQDNVRGTSGIFSYYRLGDAGTTAVDDRGQANGTYVSGPVAATSLIAGGDSSRDFDGVNDLVDMSPTPFGTPAAFSVEAWVRVDTSKSSGSAHFLVTDAQNDISDGFSLVVDSSNRPVLWVARTSSTRASATGPALTLGQTAHVVGVYTGTALRLYVNGTLRSTVSYSGGITWASGRDLRLGTQFGPTGRSTRFLDGRLDEVALYRSALTDAQVASHNSAGR